MNQLSRVVCSLLEELERDGGRRSVMSGGGDY